MPPRLWVWMEIDDGPFTETDAVPEPGPTLIFSECGPPEGFADSVTPDAPVAWVSAENETSPVPVIESIVALS